MKKSKIIECQVSLVCSSPEINFKYLYTTYTVLYKSGIIKHYKRLPKTVAEWIDNKNYCSMSDIFNPRDMTITFNYNYKE